MIRDLKGFRGFRGFREVVSGYKEKEALIEARKCLRCKDPRCISGCPVGIDIKRFIAYILEEDYGAAYRTIREKNNFPSICGRVCPAEYQCRKACVLPDAINIHLLERFVGDWGMSRFAAGIDPDVERVPMPQLRYRQGGGRRVAVAGSGPAGLCAAGELALAGTEVVIFEGLQEPGGVLRYGIPSFRLPRRILDFEISRLKALGVRIITNFIVGRTRPLSGLFAEGFDAVFLGLGAGTPRFLGLPGENLCNICSANEFLVRINLMHADKFPRYHTPVNIGRKIVVVGGGNTAVDAARCALRLQAAGKIKPDVTLLYRRRESEMPARAFEIAHAKEEGVKFHFLAGPARFLSDGNSFLRGIECVRYKSGEPDSSGRRKPVMIKGSNFKIASDQAIIAIGAGANRILTSVTPEIKVDKYFDVVVDFETMRTSVERVYAGGDIVRGEGTVIEAMGMAKRAARNLLLNI